MINFRSGKPLVQGMAEEMKGFFVGKMRQEALQVKARRTRMFWLCLAAAAVLFALLYLVCRHFLRPFSDLTGGMDLWALYLLLPLTVSVLAFSVLHILSLRSVLNDFRAKVTAHFAEFISPGVVYDPANPIDDLAVRDSLLFPDAATVSPGPDRFRGVVDGVGYEFCHLGVTAPLAGPGGLANGLFFHAVFPRPFRSLLLSAPEGVEVSLSAIKKGLERRKLDNQGELVRLDEKGLGRQLVVRADGGGGTLLPTDTLRRMEELRLVRKVQSWFSCMDTDLYVALLAPQADASAGSCFENFQFDPCLNFSIEARVCLELVHELSGRPDLFAE